MQRFGGLWVNVKQLLWLQHHKFTEGLVLSRNQFWIRIGWVQKICMKSFLYWIRQIMDEMYYTINHNHNTVSVILTDTNPSLYSRIHINSHIIYKIFSPYCVITLPTKRSRDGEREENSHNVRFSHFSQFQPSGQTAVGLNSHCCPHCHVTVQWPISPHCFLYSTDGISALVCTNVSEHSSQWYADILKGCLVQAAGLKMAKSELATM